MVAVVTLAGVDFAGVMAGGFIEVVLFFLDLLVALELSSSWKSSFDPSETSMIEFSRSSRF